jgi:dolichol-phosphate mannosyltransferase
MLRKSYDLINKKILHYQFLRFAVVGTTGAVIDFTILIVLTEVFGVYYLASSIIAFALANLSNFIWNKLWTFRNKSDKHVRQFFSFLVVGVVGLLINTGVLYYSVELLGFYYIIGKVIASAVVMFWNFFMNKYLTFKYVEKI